MNPAPQAAPEYHAWYSWEGATMKEEMNQPTVFWETKDGKVVEVTEVTRTNKPSSSWGDLVYKGPVKCFHKLVP